MNNAYLKFAESIAREAGKIMLKYFNEDVVVDYKKTDATIVTIADREINQYLIACVKKEYPNHSVIGEEESFGKSNHIWVCDPLDGTNMYARHIPVSVFSLALVVYGEPIIGVVLDPFTDNLYTAIKGDGAYKNGKKISVSSTPLNDRKSVANFEMWMTAPYDIYKVVSELGRISYFSNIGSIIRASMAVASGKFTAAIFPGKNCCHDIAAVKVIVEEAGGKVTSLFGCEQRYDQDIDGAVVSNGIVHDQIVYATKRLCR